MRFKFIWFSLPWVSYTTNIMEIPSAIREPEWLQEFLGDGYVCHVSGSRKLSVAPAIAHVFNSESSNQRRPVTLQTFSTHADSVYIDGSVSYDTIHNIGYLFISHAIILFTTEGVPSLWNTASGMTAEHSHPGVHVFTDYELHLQCNDISNQASLPKVQEYPTPAQPFVFLHIDKVAGTKLRKILYESSVNYSYGNYIPCFGQVHCVVFSLEPTFAEIAAKNVSVIAGHFAWNIWTQFPGYVAAMKSNSKASAPPCFIMFRNPVSRVVSYYYKRVYVPGHPTFGIKLNDATVEFIDFVVTSMRHVSYLSDNHTAVLTDDGLSDAACRTVLDSRQTSGKPIDTMVIENSLGTEEGLAAYENARQCIIGMQDDMENTFQMLAHWFPWLKIDVVDYTSKSNAHDYDVNEVIKPELIRAIAEANKCDIVLYRRVRQQFLEQLEYLKRSNNLKRVVMPQSMEQS